MLIIHEKLTKLGIMQEVHGFCEVFLSSLEEFEKLKRCLQRLMSQVMVHIIHEKNEENVATLEPLAISYLKQDTHESPLVICFPAPFSLESTKVVPWNYGATTYAGDKPLVIELNVTNIVGIGGMTHSDRVFATEKPQRKIIDTSKGKEVSSSNMKMDF